MDPMFLYALHIPDRWKKIGGVGLEEVGGGGWTGRSLALLAGA